MATPNSFPKDLVKEEFKELKAAYFNSAYFGPSPERSRTYLESALSREFNPSFYSLTDWISFHEQSREILATLLQTSPSNIAHHNSASDIVNIVARGLSFKKNDKVVCFQGDYPSNIMPWMAAEKEMGFSLQLLQHSLPDVDWLKTHLPKQTRVLCIGHVQFDTGKKIDILEMGKFLKERDIFFVVDSTQSFGGLQILPSELEVIDVLACACYKWLLGPYGHAFGHFSDSALESVHHKQGNWISSKIVQDPYNLCAYTLETLPGARKYDRGQTPNMLGQAALLGGLDLIREIGLSVIEKHNQSLVAYFLENFPRKHFEVTTPLHAISNIVALRSLTRDLQEVANDLKKEKIDVSIRQSHLRLSFHLFNTVEQVRTMIRVLEP